MIRDHEDEAAAEEHDTKYHGCQMKGYRQKPASMHRAGPGDDEARNDDGRHDRQ